jgi:hypothetical protein
MNTNFGRLFKGRVKFPKEKTIPLELRNKIRAVCKLPNGDAWNKAFIEVQSALVTYLVMKVGELDAPKPGELKARYNELIDHVDALQNIDHVEISEILFHDNEYKIDRIDSFIEFQKELKRLRQDLTKLSTTYSRVRRPKSQALKNLAVDVGMILLRCSKPQTPPSHKQHAELTKLIRKAAGDKFPEEGNKNTCPKVLTGLKKENFFGEYTPK